MKQKVITKEKSWGVNIFKLPKLITNQTLNNTIVNLNKAIF